MAIESKRGCGYRKVNGIYLVGGKLSAPCDRLPFKLEICPCCGAGIKFSRGFTWIEPAKLFGGNHAKEECTCVGRCPVCMPEDLFEPRSMNGFETAETYPPEYNAGLLWIGEKFYSPESFNEEASEMGISRRINTIPHDFELGKTWIFFAHKKAIKNDDDTFTPAIISAFRPNKIEKIVLQSEYDEWKKVKTLIEKMDEADQEKYIENYVENSGSKSFMQMERDTKRGITLIPVPDDDKDHNPKAN